MRSALEAAGAGRVMPFEPPGEGVALGEMPVLRALRWARLLQQAAGLPIFAEGRVVVREPVGNEIRFGYVLPWYGHPSTAVSSLAWAAQSLRDLVAADGVEAFNTVMERVREAARNCMEELVRLAPQDKNTFNFLFAAHEADIYWRQVSGNICEFGFGEKSRWLDSTFTDQTCALGARLAHNKGMAAQVLRRVGLPVPPHALARTPEEAREIAQRLGYPVVIKPLDLERGQGVATGLASGEAVRKAWSVARGYSENVLVEKHVGGQDYRLVVSHGHLIWAVTRQPGGITGDGLSTVLELLNLLNSDPRRGRTASSPLRILDLDDEARDMLAEAALELDSVPEVGRFVPLRRQANVATGGMPIAVMDEVHPDNAELAVRAAKALRLDIAGIDLLIPDIRRSWMESGGWICEVNAQTQFGTVTGAHLYGLVLKELLPDKGRIPLILVLGTSDLSDQTGAALRSWLVEQGFVVGYASPMGAWIGGRCILPAGVDFFEKGQAILSSTDVRAAVLVGSVDDVRRNGLPFDRCDVVVFSEPEIHMASPGSDGDTPFSQVFQMVAPHGKHLVIGFVDAVNRPQLEDVGQPQILIPDEPGAEGVVGAVCRVLGEEIAFR